MHTHTYSGQTLKHEHDGDDQEHGYFGHTEDEGSPDFGAGTYEYLGKHAQIPVVDYGFDPAFAIRRAEQLSDRISALGGRAAKDPELAALWQGLRDELGMVIYMQPAYAVTRPRIEELAGREVTDEEFARIAKAISFSTVDECVMGAVEQVTGPADDEDTQPVAGAKVYGGFTHDELSAAFELVKPMHDWKLPIKATVTGSTDVMLLHAAVEFFTGSEATIVSDPVTGALHVTAPGYYACIGS